MSNSKKKREVTNHRDRSVARKVSFVRPDIQREIRYVTQLAQAEDARIVSLGNLVWFSTRTRDAWLLDVDDDISAACRSGATGRGN